MGSGFEGLAGLILPRNMDVGFESMKGEVLLKCGCRILGLGWD